MNFYPSFFMTKTIHRNKSKLDMLSIFFFFFFSFVSSESIARESKIHSYGKSFNGFAARLLPHEVERLQGMCVFICIILQKTYSFFGSITLRKLELETTQLFDNSDTKNTLQMLMALVCTCRGRECGVGV